MSGEFRSSLAALIVRSLLPESSPLAVEIRDLVQRWSEIPEIPAISRLLDWLLAWSGLAPDNFVWLAGERAVLALVAAHRFASALIDVL